MSTQPAPVSQPAPESQPTPVSQPAISLPARVPQQQYRPAQSNVPDDRRVRDQLKTLAAEAIDELQLVPPMSFDELKEHALHVRQKAGVHAIFDDYIAVLLNNAAWRDTLAQIPYERRLLLIPKCLRVEEHCPAPFDEFGLLCKECGLCSIQDLTVEADRLGYAVLVAEGSAIVRSMIATGKIEAIVGVSCLNVLEKSFPHMEAAAVPGIAIPLLQDDCINCTVDLDWVWDVIHLTADDQTYRLDLETLKQEVQSWFTADSLDSLMGPADDVTSRIGRDWLSRSGKRWRPYLSTCVHVSLECDKGTLKFNEDDGTPQIGEDLKKLAVAVECFHKASLIHDDIEDGDAKRYGQPTLHVEHGEAVALNVGDFLLGEGYRLISNFGRVAHQSQEHAHIHLVSGADTDLPTTFDEQAVPIFERAAVRITSTAVPGVPLAVRITAGGAATQTQLWRGKHFLDCGRSAIEYGSEHTPEGFRLVSNFHSPTTGQIGGGDAGLLLLGGGQLDLYA